MTTLDAKNTTLLCTGWTLTPAHVVRARLSRTTWVIAHESFLLFTFWADHGVGVRTSVSHLLALLAGVFHAFGTVWRAHAAAEVMIALRTPRIPQQAHLLAPSALCMRAPSASNPPWLHAERAIAPERLRALAPAVLVDTLVAIFTHGVAEVICFLEALRALAHHLSNISEPCLQPACLVIVRTCRL